MRLLETWGRDFEAEARRLLETPDTTEDLLDGMEDLLLRYREIRDGGDEILFKDQPEAHRTWSMDSTQAGALFDDLQPDYRQALRMARESILDFYQPQRPKSWFTTGPSGEMYGQRVAPLKRAAFVMPRGWRFTPTTLMMYLAPAYVAGVEEVYLNIPTDVDGTPPDAFSIALGWDWNAHILYNIDPVDAVFAFATGTESVPKVEVIVASGGPGISKACMLVSNEVATKVISESNETMILADMETDVRVLAADLFALSEDPALSRLTVITPSMVLANELEEELVNLSGDHPKGKEAYARIRALGILVLTRNLEEALGLVERFPPKHLSVCVDRPLDLLKWVHHAGVVYLGRNTPAGIEHFFASASNLTPVSRAVALRSPLSVNVFMKASSLVHYNPLKVQQMHEIIAALAQGEDLPFHEAAFRIRMGL
jgi:histidinol dehydrogenase